MQIQGAASGLPSARVSGGAPNALAGNAGELLVSELFPPYYSLAKAGKLFTLGGSALNPTAFTGGAAGTPLIGLYNPASSGVDLVILKARLGIRTTGSAGANLDFNWFGVAQGGVAVTGTQTAARQVYSLGATGSAAYGMVNTANTAALASALLQPSLSLGNVTTTAGLNAGVFDDLVNGSLIVPPGAYLALGASASLTSASIDVSVIWGELPA